MSEHEQHSSKAVERFIFFSDAVFAFALTLLAVELKLPPHDHRITQEALIAALAASVPALVCYVISYLVVALMWIRHHRLFEAVRNYDRKLIALNFVLLFCVSLIPFVIEVVTSTGSSPLSMAIYAGVLGAIGLASFALWWHLQRTPGLLAAPLTGRAFVKECVAQATFPVFALSLVAVALLVPKGIAPIAMGAAGVAVGLFRRAMKRFAEEPAAAPLKPDAG